MRADLFFGKQVRAPTESATFTVKTYGVHFREGDDGMTDGVAYLRLPRIHPGGSAPLPFRCFRLQEQRFTVRGRSPRAVSGGPSTGRTQGFRWHRCYDHSGQPLGL